MIQPLLKLNNISSSYDFQPILKQLSLSIEPGEIAALLGPSGCGKTTVLRAIAGFVDLDSGDVSLNGEHLASAQHSMPPEHRGIGIVFQDYALFPHLSVFENLAFGLDALDTKRRKERVSDMLDLVGLTDKQDLYPHQLSGGQQQRVALARALAPRPSLLLLDEPFSNLDTELRQQLASEVRSILKRARISALIVTHDQREAFTVADKMGVLMGGEIQQWGTPSELFYQPSSLAVAKFVSPGTEVNVRLHDHRTIDTPFGLIKFDHPMVNPPETEAIWFVRPTDLCINLSKESSANIERVEFLGERTEYVVIAGQTKFIIAEPGIARFKEGDAVKISAAEHITPMLFSRPL